MVAARLYDVDGATQRLIARGVQRPLNPGGGADGAGLPAAPAGLDGPARPRAQARAAGAGLAVPAHGHRPAVGHGQRPAAAAAGRRRARPRPRQRRDRGLARRRRSSRPAPSSPATTRPRPTGGAGGTVPATLSLTLGAAATFGAFTPGVDREYTASTTATVISHRRRRGADRLRSRPPDERHVRAARAAARRDRARDVDRAGVQRGGDDHVPPAHRRRATRCAPAPTPGR